MPNYEFESEAGERIARFYEFADCPSVGTVIEVDGVRYTRIPSWASIVTAVRPDFTHVSNQIASNHPHAPRHVGPLRKAAFEGVREIREFEAKTGMRFDGLTDAVDGAHDPVTPGLDSYWERTREVKERFQRAQELKRSTLGQ